MRLGTDDDIYRAKFREAWIDNRGQEMQIIARYYTWGFGIGVTLAVFAVLFWVVGLSFTLAAGVGVVSAIAAAPKLADRITGEHTVRSWWATLAGEVGAWQRRSKPVPWALRGLDGDLATTKGGTTAWFVEHPVQWSYLSDPECESSLDALVRGYATLAGRNVHQRVSQRQQPVEAWAARLHADTPNPVDGDAWEAYLNESQRVLHRRPLTEPVVYLGVELDRSGWFQRGQRAATKRDADLRELREGLSEIARPATQTEMEWLLHRSVGLCLPAPAAQPTDGGQPLDEATLPGVFDSVDVDPGQLFSKSTRIVAAPGRNGPSPVVRHVVVMSVGRIEEQTIPGKHDPWLARVMQAPGVEVSVRGRIQSGTEAAKRLKKPIDRIVDQDAQYGRHKLVKPPHLARVLGKAVTERDVMEEGHSEESTRWDGWVRVAVDGATEQEASDRAIQLRKHMAKQRIALEFMRCQEAAYREFVPGEPLGPKAFEHRAKIRLFAAAVPQASAAVGDGAGLRLGCAVSTVGAAETPFHWDTHAAIEQADASGVTPVIGEKGSGKSTVLGALAALKTLQGVDCTVLDPAGQLAEIVKWEPIAAHSVAMHVLESEISPYGVFPRTLAADFDDSPELAGLSGMDRADQLLDLLNATESRKQFERRGLVLDCLRLTLPHGLATNPLTESLLARAVRLNGGAYTASVKGVIDELGKMRGGDPHAEILWETLSELAEHPAARNWINARYTQDTRMVDQRLLVLSMDGMRLPQRGSDPNTWGTSERLHLPALMLGVHYAYSRVYRKGDRNARKLVGFDEAHYLADWASGQSLLARMERESRRWNIRVLVASQDADTTLAAQAASEALISDVIVGHCTSEVEQQKCAGLLKMSPGFGPSLGQLRPSPGVVLAEDKKWRDFMVRINGRVGRVRFALDEVPELRALLNTTPTQRRALVEVGS